MTEPTDRTEHVPGQLAFVHMTPEQAAASAALADWRDRITAEATDLSPDELREADARVREELDSIRRRRTEYRDRSLSYLTEKARDAATARDELDAAVAEARNAGATWQE